MPGIVPAGTPSGCASDSRGARTPAAAPSALATSASNAVASTADSAGDNSSDRCRRSSQSVNRLISKRSRRSSYGGRRCGVLAARAPGSAPAPRSRRAYSGSARAGIASSREVGRRAEVGRAAGSRRRHCARARAARARRWLGSMPATCRYGSTSSLSGGASIAITVSWSLRADAEIAAEARVGRGRREREIVPAEVRLEPVAQQVEPGIVACGIRGKGASESRMVGGRDNYNRHDEAVRRESRAGPATAPCWRSLACRARGARRGGRRTAASCRRCPPPDPRLEELLQADPDDPRIDITSDQGDLGRDRRRQPPGNVRIRMGQRLLTADAAEIDAESAACGSRARSSTSTRRCTCAAGRRVRRRRRQFRGRAVRAARRGVRGAADDVQAARRDDHRPRRRALHRLPAGQRRLAAARRHASRSTRRRASARAATCGSSSRARPSSTRRGSPFPVGDQRKSGLLFPTIGNSSKSGAQVAVPYYWNIAPNYDVTFTPRYFSSRGLRLDPEFRYLTERSQGTFNAEYLFDDLDGRRLAQPRRPDARHAPAADHAPAGRRGERQRRRLFRGLRRRLRGHERHVPRTAARGAHDTDHWSFTGRVQDYQIIDPETGRRGQPYPILPQAGGDRPLAGPGAGAGRDAARRSATNFDRDTGVHRRARRRRAGARLADRRGRHVRGRQRRRGAPPRTRCRHRAGHGRVAAAQRCRC